MTRGAKKRGASRGRGKAKTSQRLADHKDPASDDSDDQTNTPADSNMKGSESKGKSVKATKKSRPENTEPQRDEGKPPRILANVLQSMQMPCKCLAINKNGFRLLMIFWRKQEEYTFLANIRSMFLIFITPQKSR